MKPFSQACENNKHPILERISPLLINAKSVLEIGAGTGQHSVYFAEYLPHLVWHASDIAAHLPGIAMWHEEAGLANLAELIALDVTAQWPHIQVDAVYAANTLHIMPWEVGQQMIVGAAKVINKSGMMLIYGPFKYDGRFTSSSNARFDLWLKQQLPHQGVRDIEAVKAVAQSVGFSLENDFAMPANNQLLVFRKAA